MIRPKPNLAGVIVILMVLMIVGSATAATLQAGNQYKVTRSDMTFDGKNYVESIDLLFNVKSGGELSLGTTTGSVQVLPWSKDSVRLVITKRAQADDYSEARRMLEMFRIQALHGGKDLSLTARARTRECAQAVGVTYTIWVPKSYNLDIKTEKGSIDIGEVVGKLVVHTGDGTISLDVDTENLDIEVEDNTSGAVPEEGVEPAPDSGSSEEDASSDRPKVDRE